MFHNRVEYKETKVSHLVLFSFYFFDTCYITQLMSFYVNLNQFPTTERKYVIWIIEKQKIYHKDSDVCDRQ